MSSCGECGKLISSEEKQKGTLSDIFNELIPGRDWNTMPNVMEELAMKCDRCGTWICNGCASKTALDAGAGMIEHTGCGGMFRTP